MVGKGTRSATTNAGPEATMVDGDVRATDRAKDDDRVKVVLNP